MARMTGPGGDGFTPFVPTLHTAVVAALRRLFAVGAGARVSWVQRPDRAETACGPLQVDFDLGAAGTLTLDLADVSASTEAVWVRGERLTLGYRRPEQPPAGWDAILGRMERAFRAREGQTAPVLAAALAQVRRFDGVRDHMFRQLSPGRGGVFGTLRLGFGCNQNCGFCWQSRTWAEPPDELYLTWLDEIAASGARHLNLTGGEPTLHSALVPLIARAVAVHGLDVELETNAIQLRKPRRADELKASGLRALFVSLHSMNAEVSDAMTRAPGTHRGTVAGVHAALDAGLEVTLNCVVERANLPTLADYASQVTEQLVVAHAANPVRRVTFTHPCDAYDPSEWDRAVPPMDEIGPPVAAAAGVLAAAGVAVDVMGTCGFPACAFADDIGLIRSLSPAEVNDAARDGRAYADVCNRCAAKPHCLGVRHEYLERFGAEGLRPFAVDPSPAAYLPS